MALVEVNRLVKRYGRFVALADCSLRVSEGEIVGLLGPNGAGKSTLIRLLMGYLRPSEGAAHILDLDCYRQSPLVHRHVAYLPGETRLFPWMRGRDFLKFYQRMRSDFQPNAARELADELELDLSRRIARMSTGMRQQLSLVCVLACDAPLWILDEPTSHLDPTVRERLLSWLRQARDHGRAVLFSSHVLAEVEQVSDRVAILKRGSLVHEQEMGKLRRVHRIQIRRESKTGLWPEIPAALANQLTIRSTGDDEMVLDADGSLGPVLRWLAQCSLDDVAIRPLGMGAVYERFHGDAPGSAVA